MAAALDAGVAAAGIDTDAGSVTGLDVGRFMFASFDNDDALLLGMGSTFTLGLGDVVEGEAVGAALPVGVGTDCGGVAAETEISSVGITAHTNFLLSCNTGHYDKGNRSRLTLLQRCSAHTMTCRI